SSGAAPPGFADRWSPAPGDAAAWRVVESLSNLIASWPPTIESFHWFADSLNTLLGGAGHGVEPPRAEAGALSVRIPALTLPGAPRFRPASIARGLLLVVPAVTGASLPSGVGDEEPVLVVRLREGLQIDRRAIRLEGAQLVPILADPHRATNIWRIIG